MPLLNIAAHLDIRSPAGEIQVSGDTSSLTFTFREWSTLFATYKQLRRMQRSGIKLADLDWLKPVQGKVVFKEREVATICLQQGGLTRLMSVRVVALRPLNFLSALISNSR